MNTRDLIKLLKTSSGEDSGCEDAFALLDHVEAELEGRDVQTLLPAVAEHLRNCGPCSEDHAALLTLLREHIGIWSASAGQRGGSFWTLALVTRLAAALTNLSARPSPARWHIGAIRG
jgi:hypothetical protein